MPSGNPFLFHRIIVEARLLQLLFKRRFVDKDIAVRSHPAGGAWIEITLLVERDSLLQRSHPAGGAWIEICVPLNSVRPILVAPRRGVWIEIGTVVLHKINTQTIRNDGSFIFSVSILSRNFFRVAALCFMAISPPSFISMRL